MKPYVICHMNASVDGRILGSRWRPAENRMAGRFERLHDQLGGGSWLIGRVTGSEYAKAAAYPTHTDQTYPREPWFAQRFAPTIGCHSALAPSDHLRMADRITLCSVAHRPVGRRPPSGG